MSSAFHTLPPLLLQFTATAVLAFVLGLELHSYRRAQGLGTGFGTTRTLTLIGVAGFVLWLLGDTSPRWLYLAGLAALSGWLAIDFVQDRPDTAAGGRLLPAMIAWIAYALGPLVLTQPAWLVAAVLVVALLMLAERPSIQRLADAMPASEGATLAKFLIVAGLVLPLMPDTPIPALTGISYRAVWTAVVLVSALSYAGYLAHAYFLPARGTLFTGLLGGLYSSTAATVVLARQARADAGVAAQAPAATVLASAMMYVRLWLVILVLGHGDAARQLALPFAVLLAGSLAMGGWLWRHAGARAAQPVAARLAAHNPLDLSAALLFAGLFVAFAALTAYVAGHYGSAGLHVLSFLIGFTDIDPFVLSLLAGQYRVDTATVTTAILIATGSNNLLKALYALVLSRQRAMRPAAAWLVLTLLVSLLWAFYA